MHDIWEFVVSVLSLQFVLLGGSVLTVAVGLIEKFGIKRSVSIATYARIVAVLLLFACFQAWQQERHSKIGREGDLHRQEMITLDERQMHRDCQGSLRIANDMLQLTRGSETAKNVQIGSQQVSLSECLLQLGKVQEVEPLKLTPYAIPAEPLKTPNGLFVRRYLVLTNKIYTPVRVVVVCKVPIADVQSYIFGAGARMGGGWGGKFGTDSFGVGILSPAMTQRNPLMVTVTAATDPVGCMFGDG